MERNIEDIAKRYYLIHQESANSLVINDTNEPEAIDDRNLVENFLNDLTNRLKIKLIAGGKVSNVLMKYYLSYAGGKVSNVLMKYYLSYNLCYVK